ncbi:MAG: hypothetical protein H6730_28740 [Deltaproteobacteria bacterium]|nr:hypothetical protein [Deltaproteobacteria bacterium]
MGGGALTLFTAALALMGTGDAAPQAPSGFVQVKADAGVEILLDGAQAVAEDLHGVTFRDVAPGIHSLVARRQGAQAQHALITVEPGQVTVHHLAPWRPEGDKAGESTLILQTLPVDAIISAPSLGLHKHIKGDEPLVLRKVPAGTHKLTFCNDYKCIDHRVEVHARDIVSLLVDFDPGEIRDESATFLAHLARLTERCLGDDDGASCRQACTLTVMAGRPSPACARVEAEEPTNIAGSAKDDGDSVPATSDRALPLP